ncbi:MAG TPA: SRPBCC family protein [Solirubrobacteraceae bacterium]|jgi:uncharacterized protein YndB with AHSA1/START domain
MPTARARRTLSWPPEAVWSIVGDPRELPRWWPHVVRVENTSTRGFTEVLATARGRQVRADFRVTGHDPHERHAWSQEIADSPFAKTFRASDTEIVLERAPEGGTEVRLKLRQRLRGLARLGGFIVRRAGRRQLRRALDGLEEALS